jgi:ABC-type glycerol-3-phosphate transport system substrate-binding protein
VAVLDFYAQGVRQGIFSASLLNYTTYGDYWNSFVSAETNMVGVDSVSFLSRRTSVQNMGLGPIPTLGGARIAALDGWLWVLTTTDPDHQQQARAFLSWMMRISQQSAYTEVLGILPSQTRALRLWDDVGYAEFAQELLPGAQIISQAQRSSSAAVALQESFRAVLEGASVSVAADAALARLEG